MLEIEEVKHDVERLLMITKTLWSIVKEDHQYDDEDLVRRVLEIDARDGRVDGRLAAQKHRDCWSCHRPLMRDRRRCIYCGEATVVDLFER